MIIGQVPFVDLFLRRKPLRKLLPFLSTKHNLITRLALEELNMRKQLGKEQIDERKDLLSQLLEAHRKQPEKSTEGDVFAISHGAMYVSRITILPLKLPRSILHIFAGSDSTASTMQSFFYHILRPRDL